MSRPKSRLVWFLFVAGGVSALCCTGTLGLFVWGLFSDERDSGPSVSSGEIQRVTPGQRGEPGAFAFDPPQGWTRQEGGRFILEWSDTYGATLGVEALRLPGIPGLDDGEGKTLRLWRERVVADWSDVPPSLPVLRRFVANGARAFFTGGVVRHKENGRSFRVSLYLVEADDRFEPLVFIQSYLNPGPGEALSASMSWDTSYAKVEHALYGVRGSPVALPLVADAEVVGAFVHGSSAAAQYVNTFSGSTTLEGVSSRGEYTFGADHTFQYKYVGASGPVGAMKFGSENDQGTWSVKYDLLTVAGAQRTRRFLLIGAPRTPEGKRTLYLMPEHPGWSLAPSAVGAHGELYVEKD